MSSSTRKLYNGQDEGQFDTEMINLTNFAKKLEDEENIREQISQKKKKVSKSQLKLSPAKYFLYFVYVISFLVFVQIISNYSQAIIVNNSLKQHFQNENFVKGEIKVVNKTMLHYEELATFEQLDRFVKENVILGLYDIQKGFKTIQSEYQEFHYYNIMTPLRILVNRAITVENTAQRKAYPTRWDLERKFEEKSTYGNGNYKFVYKNEQQGYAEFIPVGYIPPNVPIELFQGYVEAGIFDIKTSKIAIDFALYNSIDNLISYVKFSQDISGSTRIANKEFLVYSFNPSPYKQSSGGLHVVTALFMTLFCFYLVQETIKIKQKLQQAIFQDTSSSSSSNKKSPIQKNTTKNAKKLAQQTQKLAKEANARLRRTIKTILAYVFSFETLLDLGSIILSLIIIIYWLRYIGKSSIIETIEKLGLKNGLIESEKVDDELIQVMFGFNQTIKNIVSDLKALHIMAAVNTLILLFKLLRYTANFFEKLKDMVEIIFGILERLLPFLVFLFTVKLSFALMGLYYYGTFYSIFSSLGKALLFLITGLHGNLSEFVGIYQQDQAFTLIYFIFIVFIINFILASMFLIYVIHDYQDYFVRKKKKEDEEEDKSTWPFDFIGHPVYLVKNFFKVTLKLKYYKIFKKEKYEQLNTELKIKEISDHRMLQLFTKFKFNVSIFDSINKMSNVNRLFQNDVMISKVKAVKRIKLVKTIWYCLGLMGLMGLLLMIADQHQKIVAGRKFIGSIETTLNQRFVENLDGDGNSVNQTSFDIGIFEFRNLNDMRAWFVTLFTSYAQWNSFQLNNGKTFTGYYFQGTNYMLTDHYRLTIRKKKVIDAQNFEFNALANRTLGQSFAYTTKSPLQEMKTNFEGKLSGRKYIYNSEKGYQKKGGFSDYLRVNEVPQMMPLFASDGAVDQQLNSLVVDFPVYQISTGNIAHVVIAFTLDDGYNVNGFLDIELIPLDLYGTPYQVFVAVLEVIMVLLLFDYGIFLYINLRDKFSFYNYWHYLNIQDFPKIMKDMREKKTPEWIRRLYYVLEFRQLFDLLFMIFLLSSIILYIVYLVIRHNIQSEIPKFLADADNDGIPDFKGDNQTFSDNIESAGKILTVLRVTESCLVIILAVQIVYYYSGFSAFKSLTTTLSRAFRTIPQIFIVLMVFLIGFGLFMHFILGDTFSEYNTVGSSLQYSLQGLSTLNSIEKRRIFQGESQVIIALFYYLPFVLFIKFLASNLFLGSIYHKYNEVKETTTAEKDEHLTVKEFFKVSVQILRSSSATRKAQKIELNDRIVESFKFEGIYDKFEENLNKVYEFKDPQRWSVNCLRAIIDEHYERKRIKELCKDFANLNSSEDEYKQINSAVILDSEEKKPEFKLRMKYWNYFRSQNHRFNLYTAYLTQQIREIEEELSGNPEQIQRDNAVDRNLKHYILSMEEKLKTNFSEIKLLKQKLDEYKEAKKEEETRDIGSYN